MFQPESEDILSSINIPIMQHSTVASPLSYSKACDTFRPLFTYSGTANRAGLGSPGFIDNYKLCIVPSGFVLKHGFEHIPTCVENRFGHSRFSKFGTAHVANYYYFILASDSSTGNVQVMLARIFYFCVNGIRALFVMGALSDGQLFSIFVSESDMFNHGAVGTHGGVFEADVNSDFTGTGREGRNINDERDEPVALGVFDERACFNGTGQVAVFPKAINSPLVFDDVAIHSSVSLVEWDPSEFSLSSTARPKLWTSLVGVTTLDEYAADLIASVRHHIELFSCIVRRSNQVESGRPEVYACLLIGDAEIPNLITTPSKLSQYFLLRFVLDSVSVCCYVAHAHHCMRQFLTRLKARISLSKIR